MGGLRENWEDLVLQGPTPPGRQSMEPVSDNSYSEHNVHQSAGSECKDEYGTRAKLMDDFP